MASPFFFSTVLPPLLSALLHVYITIYGQVQSLVMGSPFWGLWISILGVGIGMSLWWKQYRNKNQSEPVIKDKDKNSFASLDAAAVENAIAQQPLSSSDRCNHLNTKNTPKVGLMELKQLLDGLPHGAILLQADSCIVLANPQAIQLLKLTTDQLQGRSPFGGNIQWLYPNGDLCPYPDHPIQQAIQTGQPVKNITLGLRYDQNQEHGNNRRLDQEEACWFWVSAQPQLSLEGSVTHVVFTIQDITDHQNQQSVQHVLQHRRQYFFEHTPMAMIEWDADFKVREWNRAATHTFGYAREEAMGHHVTELITPSMNVSLMNELWHRLLTTKETSHNAHENITQAGDRILCEWHHTPLLDESYEVVGITSMAQDITEKQEIEQRLIHNAFHDSLTGLPNRSLFMRKLETAVQQYRKHQTTDNICGVFFI